MLTVIHCTSVVAKAYILSYKVLHGFNVLMKFFVKMFELNIKLLKKN